MQLGADQLDRVSHGIDGVGILVRDLRLARTEGLDQHDFLYVPEAVIFHDKEHVLSDGKVRR